MAPIAVDKVECLISEQRKILGIVQMELTPRRRSLSYFNHLRGNVHSMSFGEVLKQRPRQPPDAATKVKSFRTVRRQSGQFCEYRIDLAFPVAKNSSEFQRLPCLSASLSTAHMGSKTANSSQSDLWACKERVGVSFSASIGFALAHPAGTEPGRAGGHKEFVVLWK